jgi:hypothetical protein
MFEEVGAKLWRAAGEVTCSMRIACNPSCQVGPVLKKMGARG